MSSMLLKRMQGVVGVMSKTDQKVLNYRFGLNGEGCKSIEQVCSKFKIGRDRIRQLEAKLLRVTLDGRPAHLVGFVNAKGA